MVLKGIIPYLSVLCFHLSEPLAPTNQASMETISSNPPDERNMSASSSSFGFDGEGQEPKDAQESPVESSGNVLAYLQVLGGFFLMFNSWYDNLAGS
jgi:hypothetical protein